MLIPKVKNVESRTIPFISGNHDVSLMFLRCKFNVDIELKIKHSC